MYLLSLTNIDYIFITIFFAIVFIIAYLFRHKNENSHEFLNGAIKQNAILNNQLIPIGLIEVVIAGIMGATIGFVSLYYLIPIIVITNILKAQIAKLCLNANVINLNEYIIKQFGKVSGICFALLNFGLILSLLVITNLVIFELCQSILGWSFVNSIVGLLSMTLIYTLIGGSRGAFYNKVFFYFIILFMLFGVIVVGIYQIGGFNSLINNLSQLSGNQGYLFTHYTSMDLNGNLLVGVIISFIAIAAIEIINANHVTNTILNVTTIWTSLIKIVVIVLLVMPGIIAIATPSDQATIPGKQIVTIQAQFPDGEKGYVVKAVDNTKSGDNPILGIIPPLLNSNNLIEKGQYNYSLANIVPFTHYFSKPLRFSLYMMLFALFMMGISQNLLLLARNVLNGLLLPTNVIQKYGEIGELWAIRLTILFGTLASAFIAYFFKNSFDLLAAIYLILSLFVAPLVAISLLVINIKKAISLLIPVLLTEIVTIFFIYLSHGDKSFYVQAKIIIVGFLVTYITGMISQLFIQK